MVEVNGKLSDLFNFDPKEMKDSFQSSIDAISSTLIKYSVEDVALALFVSNIWLPNISSTVTHQLLTTIFATIKPENFSTENSIKTYDDFKEFLSKIYELVPSFPSLEDFIPELDWGEIKFHCDKKNYSMFYGNELSNVHEYLMMFQMIYEPYDDGYLKHLQRSPSTELKHCLILQEKIIQGITGQPNRDDLDISPGNLEIPPIDFWENAQAFYSNFNPEKIVPESFINDFSINLGEYQKEALKYESFGDKVFNGTLIPAFFLKHESRFFTILPRRYSSILFDHWVEIFREYSEKIEPEKGKYTLRLGAKLHQYIKGRISNEGLFQMVSAVTPEGRPCKTIFTTSFISDNKLILIYLTEPTLNSKNTEKELKKITPELKKALKLIAHQPTTLALHLDRQNVQFQSKSNQSSVEPLILIVVPQVSTQLEPFSLPKNLPGRVMYLDSFLGIIDELDRDVTLPDFFTYLDEIKSKTFMGLSMLDIFASFKDSYGTLIGGALEPDFIVIDPHWGTASRYKSLAEFWKVYPEIDFFDHPRTWKLKKETATRLRLEARGYFGSAIHSKFGKKTNAFFTAPFEEMNFPQGNLSNLLMECLEDSMSRSQSIFKNHKFFDQCDRLQIIFFPISIVKENDKFRHVRHLDEIEKYWRSDIFWLKNDTYGIRVVFDENEVQNALSKAQDCSIEVDILIEILRLLNKMVPDPQFQSIIESLEKTRSGKPRFKMFAIDKPASFPELINPLKPKPVHFKRAKKRIAELARQLNISEGEYSLNDAKRTLNNLRDAIVGEINTEVSEYDYKKAITFLLARVDALNYDYERRRYKIEQGLEHEIDYQPETEHAEQHTEFLKTHKAYRYLIEKFVQIEPTGNKTLGTEKFQYLIALIDWLHVFYTASDNLHYGLFPVGMKLDTDYLVEVVYDNEMEVKDKSFGEMMSKLELGLIGNPDDRVVSPRPVEEFMDALDAAFIRDLGFSYKTMGNVLQILSFWPVYAEDVEESTNYSATGNDIEEACIKAIIDKCTSDEIEKIIDFLTLKKDDVIRILGQEDPCDDLPVWEHKKRYARYNLKPLIKIGDCFYWGPYSTRRSGMIWLGITSSDTLPADLRSKSIEEVLSSEKKLIEDALTDKTHEIVKRSTPYLRKNLELHKLKPKWSYPQELGDYDTLSYHQKSNIVLCIECKDILQPYCLKDARRLREKIFGRPGKTQGHFEQINKRIEYLKKHIIDICTALEWPVDNQNPPKILSVYLSRRTFWWTHFPPEKIETEFVRIDLLSDFINDLEHRNTI